jgi:hypothetical protein
VATSPLDQQVHGNLDAVGLTFSKWFWTPYGARTDNQDSLVTCCVFPSLLSVGLPLSCGKCGGAD